MVHANGQKLMSSYDQWKTASPYDYEPDFIQEAELFLKLYENNTAIIRTDIVVPIIQGLLGIMDEEGIT